MNRVISLLVLFSLCGLVYPQFIPGTIGNNQTICYGTAPARLIFISPPAGGTGTISYRWQRSNTNDDRWTDIAGANGSREFYFPPVLGRTTSFRCMVTDEEHVSRPTEPVVITVLEDLDAGSIQGAQAIYAGTIPQQLTEATAASGGSGPDSYTYRWQRSPDGWYWDDIEDATSAGYAPKAMIRDQWFRRFVVDPLCGSVASPAVKISVNHITIYGNEVPSVPSTSYGIPIDLGTEFEAHSDGIIPRVRLYTDSEESGLHQIRLWKNNDNAGYDLIAGPIDWYVQGGTAGWKEFDLESPWQIEKECYYIISISTSSDNLWPFTSDYVPGNANDYITYTRSFYISPVGEVPSWPADANSGFFRDFVFIPFSPGSAGSNQRVCHNSAPSLLAETITPSGADGYFTYQWQSSSDSLVWTDIEGATSPDYLPPELTSDTWFKRKITSGNLTVEGKPVLVTVNPRFILAQLQDVGNIYANTSTNINIELDGGTEPYLIEYTRNSQAITPVSDYRNRDDIYTGILNGTFTYALTSVSDLYGCNPESLGTPVTFTASGAYSGSATLNALVIINTQTTDYTSYNLYVRPYLDWFGIPYDTCDINSMGLPDLTNYSLIILGHRNVYTSGYPIAAIENALDAGVGFYSFDPHFFDYESDFSDVNANPADVSAHTIEIDPDHFITQYHTNDEYDPSNTTIELPIINNVPVLIRIIEPLYNLAGSRVLTSMVSSEDVTVPLLEVAPYGSGRIVKWNSYDWMYDDPRVLGPVNGMDDLLWRSLVWAAKKPFVMQGVQPIITMRVDDVDGRGGYGGSEIHLKDLEWLIISNEFGFIPWCGTFIFDVPENFYPILRGLINNNLATATPHSFDFDDSFIFYDRGLLPGSSGEDPQGPSEGFDAASNVIEAWDFFENNNIPVSKYMVPHWYAFSADALAPMASLGIEYIGTYIPYLSDEPPVSYPGPWLNCGPYRIERYGAASRGYALSYSGPVNWLDNDFFVCLTEIQDDGGYEWYPDTGYDEVGEIMDVAINRGIRHLRRAINSMVLPTLFTHEDRIKMTADHWRYILGTITSAISDYYPEYDIVYKSMDDACQYMRAKVNLEIEDVTAENGLVSISVTGVNDTPTKCYLFSEDEGNGEISFRMITLPVVTSNENPHIICIND